MTTKNLQQPTRRHSKDPKKIQALKPLPIDKRAFNALHKDIRDLVSDWYCAYSQNDSKEMGAIAAELATKFQYQPPQPSGGH